MSKVLFFLLAGIALYAIVRWHKRTRANRRTRAPETERMVACSHCGLNIPSSEAVLRAGRAYCSEDHRDRGTR